MENLKRQKVRGTILLEALLALGIFAMIVTLLLGQINHSRKEEAELLQKEEVLRVARMALQTQQRELTMNEIHVQVERDSQHIAVYHEGERLIYVEKK